MAPVANDLGDKTTEAERSKNNVSLQVDRHTADLIREDKLSVRCLECRDHAARGDLANDAKILPVLLLYVLRLSAQIEIVRHIVRSDSIFIL